MATLGLIEASEDLELQGFLESWISASEVYVIGLREGNWKSHTKVIRTYQDFILP